MYRMHEITATYQISAGDRGRLGVEGLGEQNHIVIEA
jgi:hypothetical protein